MEYVARNIVPPGSLAAGDQLGRLFFLKRDAFEKMNHSEQVAFFIAALKKAAKAVLLGQSKTVASKTKELLDKIHTRESWDRWIRRSGTRKWFVPKMNQAIDETNRAQRIILESRRNPELARKELEAEDFGYLDKAFVRSLFLTPQPATGRAVVPVAFSSYGAEIKQWAKDNPEMAIGLALLVAGSIFYAANH